MAKTKAKFSCGHKSDQRPTIEPMGGKTEETYSCRCEPCLKREALNLQKAIHDRNKAKKQRLREEKEELKRVRDAPDFMKKYPKDDAWEKIMNKINEADPKIEAITRATPDQVKEEAWKIHIQLYPKCSNWQFVGNEAEPMTRAEPDKVKGEGWTAARDLNSGSSLWQWVEENLDS